MGKNFQAVVHKVRNLSFFFALAAVFAGGAQAKSTVCAKARVISGDTCSSLRVEFDLTACGDQARGEPRITCSNEEAEAVLSGERNVYTARFRSKDSGAWGGAKVWTLVGRVKLKSTERAAKAAPEAPKAVKLEEKVEHIEQQVGSSFIKGWSFGAYVDAYVGHNFNRPTSPANFSATSVDAAALRPANNNIRYYDWYSRQFALNLVELSFKHTRKELAFTLDLDFGQFADINASYASGNGYVVDEVSKHIGQAIVTYTPAGAPGLVIEFGKMPTHVGLELMKAKDNWNYSRATLFGYGGPFWHTGFHLGYTFLDNMVTASGYLYNGWNTLYNIKRAPTFGGQLKFQPSDKLIAVYNWIGGGERQRNEGDWKQVHDFNVTYMPNSVLSLALDYIYGTEENASVTTGTANASWTGFGVYAKGQLHPRYYISPRYEYYLDSHGYTLGGPRQRMQTYTLTNSFTLTQGLETRFEGRYDFSNYPRRFNTFTGQSKKQTTVTLAFLFTI